jgi:hypothetical protein
VKGIDGDEIVSRIASGFAAENGLQALGLHSREAVAKPGVLIRSPLLNLRCSMRRTNR